MNDLLPSNWVYESIDRLSAPHKGAIKIGPFGSALSKKEMVSSGIKVYGQEHVYKKDFSIGNYFITEEKYQKLKTCTLERGDVVVTMMGTVGASTVVPDDADVGVMDSHLLRIQVDEKRVWSHFLSMQLRDSQDVKDQIRKMSQGGIMSGLNAAIVKSIRVPLPPLQEQQKIAAILTSVDDVIEKTQAQINKLKDLKTGMMQELLTRGVGVDGKQHTEFKDSPVGRIPKGWDVKSLGDLSSFITSGSRGWAQYYSESGAMFIRIGNLTREHINFRFKDIIRVSPPESAEGKRTLVQTGDVLISITADLGVIAVVNESLEKAYVNQHVALVRLKDIAISRWVGHYLAFEQTQKQFSANNDSGAKAGLNLTAIRNTFVALPSESEILSIVKTLDSIDDLISKKRNNLVTLNNTKKALMQDLLTGKVRVNVD
ncbi:restriction endonuclease subunit S [Photobacterium leiognathi subsp. mandapamensis]